MAGRVRTRPRPAAQRYRLIRTRQCTDAILPANAARAAVRAELCRNEAPRVTNAEPRRYSVWYQNVCRGATRQYEKCGLGSAKAGFDFHCNWLGGRMMVCSGFSGLAAALSAKPIGRDEASAASIISRRRADWIMATSHFREAYPLMAMLGPVVNWLILAGGREPHVGWWDW